MLVQRSVMEQRYEAVMAVLRDGEPVVEVASRFGVSRQSVHSWIRRYEAGGLAEKDVLVAVAAAMSDRSGDAVSST